MQRIRRMRPTYASVTATLALVLAVGMGGAYAAQKITSKGIAPGAVKSKHIKDGRVKAADLGPGSVTSQAIAPDAVTIEALADESVSGVEIKNGTVNSSDLSDSSVGTSELVPDSVDALALRSDSVRSSELAVTLRTKQVNVLSGATGNVTAECQEDEIPLAGGGGFLGVPHAQISGTAPVVAGWYAEGRNPTASPATLSASAYCLKK